jgi:hypothetical protein
MRGTRASDWFGEGGWKKKTEGEFKVRRLHAESGLLLAGATTITCGEAVWACAGGARRWCLEDCKGNWQLGVRQWMSDGRRSAKSACAKVRLVTGKHLRLERRVSFWVNAGMFRFAAWQHQSPVTLQSHRWFDVLRRLRSGCPCGKNGPQTVRDHIPVAGCPEAHVKRWWLVFSASAFAPECRRHLIID